VDSRREGNGGRMEGRYIEFKLHGRRKGKKKDKDR
jgi:hypothetical protein